MKTDQQERFEAYILGKYPALGVELLRVNDAKTQRDWEVWQAAEASALERAALECERMEMYPGARQESSAHADVWDAAKAIRALSQKEA